MKDLKLGDVLINGSVVKATMKIKNDNDPYYKLPGSIPPLAPTYLSPPASRTPNMRIPVHYGL